jgi:hypothetical protein
MALTPSAYEPEEMDGVMFAFETELMDGQDSLTNMEKKKTGADAECIDFFNGKQLKIIVDKNQTEI